MKDDIFNKFKIGIENLDPVAFAENNLTLDGNKFRINGNGYKFLSDLYRYIAIKGLESDSKPLVLVKGRQVGGTVMAGVLSLYFMASGNFGVNGKPPIRMIHCFPTLIHVYTYSKTKLNVMISSANLVDDPTKKGRKKSIIEMKFDKNADSNDSLQYKQFENGNFLRIESTGIDADRLRGGTVDVLFFDEVQDIPELALANALKLLSQAKYGRKGKGVQLFFGTPKNKGTAYYKMWNASSQQYYHLGCEKCKKYFPLYSPGSNSWEEVWVTGFTVKCTFCGHYQDKLEAQERGKWISLNDDPNNTYIGYHLNQLYMPNFSKEDILKERMNPLNTERIFQNEVLGEFYAGSSAPITEEEIHKNCGDTGRKFRGSINHNENRKVYAGFDWGKKNDVEGGGIENGGQSYSCAVVLSPNDSGQLSIIFGTMLKRNDFEEKKRIVDEMYRRYSVSLGVGDIGYANDLTEVLQRAHGHRFLASQASTNVTGKAKFNNANFPHTISFERDYYISEVYDLLKRGMIRFPFGDYEKCAWLIKHCCNMEIKTTRSSVNEPISRYVKAGVNDGFMALMNAYLAYKFDISNGFKDNNMSSIYEQKKVNQIPCFTGYLPRNW